MNLMQLLPAVLVGGALALAGAGPAPGQEQSRPTKAAPEAKFKWDGTCTIKCDGGQCRFVCDSGVVAAVSARDARLKAEAALRAKASSQGTIVEGSVKVTVDLF
jgi:hypothetical protein